MRIRAVATVVFLIGIGALLAGCGNKTAPTISTHPTAQTACSGSSVTFRVTAAGTAPLTYQWRKDGAPVSGATSSSYTINSVAPGDEGSYTVVLANAQGTATSNAATLTVSAPPAITSHPSPQTACPGNPALLSVTALGAAPLSYQWKKDGVDVPGANTAIYTITSTSDADVGSYTVVITNSCGTVTSNPATVALDTAPTITSQPLSGEVTAGTPFVLIVTATGTAPLTYQWQRDGADVADATAPLLSIPAVTADDTGSYTVVITNPCGSVTSDPATLSLTTAAVPGSSPTVEEPVEPQPTPAEVAEDTGIIGTVDGHPLSRKAFEEVRDSILSYYARLYAQFGIDIQVFLVGARGRVFQLDLELNALSNLITRGIVESAAQHRGIVISPEAIEEEFEIQYQAMLLTYGITEEFLIEYFAAEGGTLDEFKEEGRQSVAEQLLYEALQRAVVGPVELSDAELRQYFDDNAAAYGTQEEVKASHILVETEREAVVVLAELAAGEEFADLARTRSICPSAAQGGDLGWFGRGAMAPEFEAAAFALEAGETSDIVATQFGFHIILLTDRRAAIQPQFEDVADRVRTDAEGEIAEERFDAWLKTARQEATVIITDPVLHAMYVKSQDLDRGIAAFEKLQADGSVEEKYLSFIIGSLYEDRMAMLESDIELLETQHPEGPERDAQIAALEAEIAMARERALAAYQQALEDLPGDEDVLERIAALETGGLVPR